MFHIEMLDRLKGAQFQALKQRLEDALLPDRCTRWQLLRMALVIFIAGWLVAALLTRHPGSATWWAPLAAAGLVGLLLPTIYLMWGRPLMANLRELQARQEEVRALSRQLLATGEQERRRLALDLHDEFGQSLAALRWNMGRLKDDLGERLGAEARRCEELLVQVDGLGARIRHLSAALHPVMLEDLGLVPSLGWAVQELGQRHPELKVEFLPLGIKEPLPPELALALYRVAQEAMTNAVRHARPDRVTVTLTASHPEIILQVRDDGSGFHPPELSGRRWGGGLGLYGMRERVAGIGGRLTLNSAPGMGTVVRVEVPFSREVGDAAYPGVDR